MKARRWGLILLIITGIGLTKNFWFTFSPKRISVGLGTIEKGCWAETVFLRKETLLTASRSGAYTARLSSGTVIPNGEIVGWIGDKKTSHFSDDALQLARKKAAIESECLGLNREIQRLEGEIRYRKNANSQSVGTGSQVKADLLSQEKERERLLQTRHVKYQEIEKIKAKLTDLTNGAMIVTAPLSGIFSLEYDGYEERFTPDDFQTAAEELFRKKYRVKRPGHRVTKGDILGKMIEPFNEIVVLQVDPRITGIPQAGDVWYLQSNGEWREIKVMDINPLAEDKLIVGLNNLQPNPVYNPKRRQKLFLVYRRVKGLCVPARAIFKDDRSSYVKVYKGDGYLRQEVQVIETDGDQAIVSGLEFGTAIISR